MRTPQVFMVAAFLALATEAHGSGVLFEDQFDGPGLAPNWQVQAGQGTYAVSGGALLYTNQGPLSSPGGWSTTSLKLTVPFTGRYWQMDTKVTYNLYYLNPSQSSSGAQRGQVIVGFDANSFLNDSLEIDRGVDAYYSANKLRAWYGATYVDDLLNPADATIVNNVANGTYWYRVIRNGGAVSILYSYNGADYSTAVAETLANPLGAYNELILSGTTYQSVGSYASYDYVRIMDTAVPEPQSGTLLALALAGLLSTALRRTRRVS